jgi:hypothetical protein
MQITASKPTEQPARPAKTYGDLWIRSIVIRTPDDGTGSVKLETLAYDYASAEFGPNAESITTDKLWQATQEVPEVAAALTAILAAVEPLRTWVDAQAEGDAE